MDYQINFTQKEMELIERIMEKEVKTSLNIWFDLLHEAVQINLGKDPVITNNMKHEWIQAQLIQDVYDKIAKPLRKDKEPL